MHRIRLPASLPPGLPGARLCAILGSIRMVFKPGSTAAEAMRAAGALSTVGLAFVIALGIGYWLGLKLDGWLGTAPTFTIIGSLLGLVAGVVNVYRIVKESFGPPKT